MGKFDRNENSCRSCGPTNFSSRLFFSMSLEPRPVGVEPRPADGPAFVLCFQHVSINIIFLSPFAAFPLPHSDRLKEIKGRNQRMGCCAGRACALQLRDGTRALSGRGASTGYYG